MTENESTGGAFAKYRPIAELGQGGMAQVFLALASGPAGFNKLVVIKQIREQFAEDPEFLTMFLDEARRAARLNHPNVVQTNEVGGDGKRFYICMEYLEGQPLNRILTRVGPTRGVTLGMQLRILVDALEGLHHAHELCDYDGHPLQVVHRDATPHNIFVTYAGQVKVVDFGIAKALSSSSETRTGVLKGKVAYMAPEQAMGEKVDRRADLFSMGMILWEMLAGKRLFKGVPDVAVLQKIVNGSIPSPVTVKPDVAPELEAICMKALAHSRDNRYATAAEMASDLAEAIDAVGEKGSVREAGKLIEKFFAPEREKIKALVEAQATEGRAAAEAAAFNPRTGSLSGSEPKPRLPVLDGGTLESFTGVDAREHGSGSIRSGSQARPAERPSGAEAPQPSSLTASIASPLTGVGAPVAAASPRESRTRLVAAVAAAAVGAVVAVAFFASRGNAANPSGAAATTLPAPAPTVHTLLIDSTPQGATVREGDKELGKTPMTLDFDLSLTAPRRLVMTLEGYSPHTFIPTREGTQIIVPLAPLPVPVAPPATTVASTSAPEHAAAPRGPAPRVVAPPPPPPAVKPSVPSDINTAR